MGNEHRVFIITVDEVNDQFYLKSVKRVLGSEIPKLFPKTWVFLPVDSLTAVWVNPNGKMLTYNCARVPLTASVEGWLSDMA